MQPPAPRRILRPVAPRPSTTCPACLHGAPALTDPFYTADAVPAHSILLMDSPSEARAYPRADLALAACPSCGFIFNSIHDPGLAAYSIRYEETQHFSPHFGGFARRLAAHVAGRYQIRGATICEIGCGKAEFLDLLCKETQSRGVGIDPAANEDRLPAEARARIRLLSEHYTSLHHDIETPLIVCRHTFEHIGPVQEFLSSVRAHAARFDSLVLLEVPDSAIILDRTRFWDIYYEHCSYFTAGSLARLFRDCRLQILEFHRDFHDQYLWLVARPADPQSTTAAPFTIEETPDQIMRTVKRFTREAPRAKTQWRERVRALAGTRRPTLLWGAGSKAVSFLTTLDLTADDVAAAVDVNPHKRGRFTPGTAHPVIAPADLPALDPGAVIVMNPAYTGEIARTLASLGIDPKLIQTP